jgi:hypothetical protein
MVCKAGGAERRRRLLQLRFQFVQDRLDRAHDERQANEREGEPDADRRIGHLDTKGLQVLPDPAGPCVDGGQRDAGDRGGQGEGQIDQRIDDPPSGKRVAHQDPRQMTPQGTLTKAAAREAPKVSR